MIGNDKDQLQTVARSAAGPVALVELGYGDLGFGPRDAQVVITRAGLPEIPNIRLSNQAIGQQMKMVLMSRPDLSSKMVALGLGGNLPQDPASERLMRGLEVAINKGFNNLDNAIEDKDLREQVQALYFESRATEDRDRVPGQAVSPGEAQLEATVNTLMLLARGEGRDLIVRGREMAAEMQAVSWKSRQSVARGVISRHWYSDDPMELFLNPKTGEEQLINCVHDARDQSITVIFRRRIDGVYCNQALRSVFVHHTDEKSVQVNGGEIRAKATGRDYDERDLGLVAEQMRGIHDCLRQRR
jgi:hypothetical protein